MKVIESKTTVLVEPGRYYLGDPCFAIGDARWSEFCSSWNHRTFAALDGERCLTISLPHDGIYAGSDRSAYVVDAGMISLVPEVLATKPGAGELGAFLDFKEQFTCLVATDGEEITSLRFGHISIQVN